MANKKNEFRIKDLYPLLVILVLAGFLFAIQKCSKKSDTDEPVGHITSMVQLDGDKFEEALSDSCKFSSGELTCSPALLRRILQNVDSTALKKITDRSVTFRKEKEFIEVPAAMVSNMIDLGLLETSSNE